MGWAWGSKGRLAVFAAICAGAFARGGWAVSDRPASQPVVFTARVSGVVDLGLVPFVERALQGASQQNAAALILEIDTLGGRLDAAIAVRDQLLRSPLRTVAFVNMRAISAGALITLAAHEIVMAEGATIGAATPVQAGAPNEPAKPVAEKTVSYVRKEFRSTADARHRPGLIAEAMVDADVEIPGLVAKGKLLTLTTAEALKQGVANFQGNSMEAVLAHLGLTGAEIRRLDENWAERALRFLTHPVVSSLLISLAVLGLIVELSSPGFGFPGIVGLSSLVLFFWGHWLVRLLGWEEVALVAGGVLLLLLEVFVLPGFGIAGVLGILALLAGLVMALIGAGATGGAALQALFQVMVSAVLAIVLGIIFVRFLGRRSQGRSLVLRTGLAGETTDLSGPARPGLLGQSGQALTPLRPAGIAQIAGQRVDVVSRGDFIEPGEAVEVVEEAGHRVVVVRSGRK
jgi:membrane-bound serine protease (ClpP class)